MKILSPFVFLLLTAAAVAAEPFTIGADLSALPIYERRGAEFSKDGRAVPASRSACCTSRAAAIWRNRSGGSATRATPA